MSQRAFKSSAPQNDIINLAKKYQLVFEIFHEIKNAPLNLTKLRTVTMFQKLVSTNLPLLTLNVIECFHIFFNQIDHY